MDTSAFVILIIVAGLVGLAIGIVPFVINRTRSSPPPDNLSSELAVLAERVSAMERGQEAVGKNIQELAVNMVGTGARTETLLESSNVIRTQLAEASQGLAELRSSASARQDIERETRQSIQRVEAIIAGTNTRGAAGENILETMFSRLPPEWQEYNYKVAGGVVEFGLRLPNNLVLPIDHKWPAADLVDQLASAEGPDEQQRLRHQIERAVRRKTAEVCKYIDPERTVSFGIAAVPDAVYELCGGLQAEAVKMNVVLISHSLFMPYLLLVFQTVLRNSQNIDVEKLHAYLQSIGQSLGEAESEIENRLSRAITMLGNSRDDLRRHVASVSSAMTAIQAGASSAPQLTASDAETREQGQRQIQRE